MNIAVIAPKLVCLRFAICKCQCFYNCLFYDCVCANVFLQ